MGEGSQGREGPGCDQVKCALLGESQVGHGDLEEDRIGVRLHSSSHDTLSTITRLDRDHSFSVPKHPVRWLQGSLSH